MGRLKKVEWSEKKAQTILENYFLSKNTKLYEMSNLFVFDWESDYLTITRSGVIYEIEIKISRADFQNDFKHKEDKHMLLESKTLSDMHPNSCPNYFYYAVPDGLIKTEEVPEYAGLIYLNPWGVNIVKDAPKINNNKVDIESLKLIDKFYYNMLTWKRRCEDLSDAAETIKGLKKEIKGYNKTIMFYDDELSTLNSELYIANMKIKKLEDEIRQGNNKESTKSIL